MTTTAVLAGGHATERASEFVAAHRALAEGIGRDAGDLVGDTAHLVATLRAGLDRLADPAYRAGIDHVAPGIGPVAGVRQPLLRAVARGLRAATRRDRASTLLDIAGALVRAEPLELQWLAFGVLERTVRDDPERTWQLLRAAATRADNWITVDSLARPAAVGILAEPYRWSELEQLVYSPSRWERRLVGSTIAVIPTTSHTAGRTPEVARHGLSLVAELIGDAEPAVQKSLSWAVRSMSAIDPSSSTAFLRDQAARARATGDGNRAWVVRDSLEKLDPAVAAELRTAVEGIRRRPGAPSTSRAAETAAAFMGLGISVPPADRPVVDRP